MPPIQEWTIIPTFTGNYHGALRGMTDELIGKRFGGYDIFDLVGKGGMATVYKAHQVSMMNRVVALKVLPRQFLNEESYLMRFNREVKIVAQLEHRNIVPVYDYGEQDNQPFIVMRYMSGGSVDDLLNSGAVPLEQILAILEQIAPALDYAHSKNVLHRDMKPSNVLMDDNGGAYLTDFGIARIMGDPTISTATQGVIGTPSYMSPEQAQGQTLDNRSDLYSLGVMLFEMATGRRPFESDTPYGVAVMHVTAPPPSPRTLNPALPPAIEGVILTAIRKRPQDRYPDAMALAEAFRRALHDNYSAGKRDTQPAPQTAHPVEGFAGDIPLDDEPTTPTPPQFQQAPLAPVSSLPAQPPAQYAAGQGQVLQPVPLVPPMRMSFPPSTTLPPAAGVLRHTRKRGSGVMMSAVVGILIGCGLLAGVIAVGLFVIVQTTREEAAIRAQTETAESEAALATALATSGTPIEGSAFSGEETPASTPSDITPTFASVGDRPVVTALSGVVVFFAERATTSESANTALPAVGDYNVYMIDLATRQETRLTATAYAEVFPAASPDGESIAFVADRDNDWDIYVVNARTLAVRKLTQNNRDDRSPTWSPDGSEIVFASTEDDGSTDLYRMDVTGSNLRRIYDSDGRAGDPAYTADGRYLLFTEGDPFDAATWEIMRLEIASGEIVALTNNDYKDWSPSAGMNGEIVYLSAQVEARGALGYSAILTKSIDGGNPQLVFDGEGYETAPRYTPDGDLLFATDVSGRDELYLLANGQTSPERLTDFGGLHPSWFGR